MSIVVTGGSGLIGKSLQEIMPDAIYLRHIDYDLTREVEVLTMYRDIMPDRVIHLAARVGGIVDNMNHQAQYLDENILMNTLLVKYARLYGVSRFLGVLSSCIFPDVASTYPMTEEDMHKGAPPKTNFSYAMSKRLFGVQIDAYNQEYGTKYNYIIPCNIYGEHAKEDDEYKSHFPVALVKKIYEANKNGLDTITIHGSGKPIRQFIYAGDVAQVIKGIIERDITESFNIAPPISHSIDEMTRIALNITGNQQIQIEHDSLMPDGQFRKDISIDRFRALFPDFRFTSITEGFAKTYDYYKNKHDAKV